MNWIDGEILYFNKPYGWTSFRLVGRVRWLISQAIGKRIKVGHAGSLDPLATGVMVLCTGHATKRIEEFQGLTKEYIATLRLGATTPSFDMEKEVDATYPYNHITRSMVDEILKQFTGDIMQVPPIFSAIKIDGKRAYKYARQGEDVEIQAKKITIYEIEVIKFNLPELQIRVVCSKGTYIRSLARDIGIALNSGAYLTSLIRTRVGNIQLKDCMDIDTFTISKEEFKNN